MFVFLLSCVWVWFRLQTLPVHVGNLQQLKELHVRNNRLLYLPASMDLLHLYTFTGLYNILFYVLLLGPSTDSLSGLLFLYLQLRTTVL